MKGKGYYNSKDNKVDIQYIPFVIQMLSCSMHGNRIWRDDALRKESWFLSLRCCMHARFACLWKIWSLLTESLRA